MPYQPKYLVLHDYGQTPVGWKPGTPLGHNPYHALVHGGQVQYRDPNNPYAAPAPHAYKLNPQSIGLSWAGPVGAMPDEKDLAILRAEVERIKQQFPGIKVMSHGEAYAMKGQIPQASKDGRGMAEASWRHALGGPMPVQTASAGDFRGPAGAIGPAGSSGGGSPYMGGSGPAPGSFRAAQDLSGADAAAPAPAAAAPQTASLGALDFNSPNFGASLGALGNKLGAMLQAPSPPSVNLVRPPQPRVDLASVLSVLEQRANRQRGI